MSVQPGWQGRFFEDFEIGDVYQHPLGRTVTETDNIWFTLLTMNTNQMHFNTEYAAKSEFGKPLVVSTLTVAIAVGQSVIDLTQNAFANLGWDDIKMTHPVFAGDTLYSESVVLEKRESAKPSARRDRHRQDPHPEPGRRRGLLVQADVLRLQARRRAAPGDLPRGQDGALDGTPLAEG